MDHTDRSIPGFCRRQKISRSSYYNLKTAGLAPREYVIGKLVRISPEAEADWVKAREADGDARRAANTEA
ncbi:transcriptional regulator [Mesorhizobium sp. M2E.F.Ca.ET.166.01.1.1]|nr:transcriptional regulator [Mesorhizobium sp. M2E.F.Ca.ET.219.01.1.1]TGT78052.1 transcriptional regulator [Mesorhizobium sp. M2E.F.Ca.ET.166.01.1.1]TGW04169.1 transcriptional regulator [Mesorhizobium sp. M2E.F.Ca.ET.154.01.1.1]